MIDRLSRASLRTVLALPFARGLVTRLRQSALLGEDIVPFGVHRFDRQTWVIKETSFGTRIWCSLDERSISRPILLGTYEPAEVRFIASAVKPGDLAVDAGANIGYHGLHLAKIVGESGCVELFEPLPYLADAVDASIAENGFGARTRLHRIGLDERAGSVRLRHAPRTENFGGGHFAPDDAPPEAHADEVVATARLDDIIGERRCSFIKIDVEGAEPRVMRGALQTLARGRPVILSELHERQLRIVSGAGADDFIAQMAAVAYRCSHLNSDGTRGATIERYADAVPLNVVFDPAG